MPNREYQQGRAFEYKVIKDLESRGAVTIRAAGSKGAGKVDVVAVWPPRVRHLTMAVDYLTPRHLWIQCKRTGTISPGEWNRLYEVAGWACAAPVLAQNGPAGRGVTYWCLDAQKVPGSRLRPYSALVLPPKLEPEPSTVVA